MPSKEQAAATERAAPRASGARASGTENARPPKGHQQYSVYTYRSLEKHLPMRWSSLNKHGAQASKSTCRGGAQFQRQSARVRLLDSMCLNRSMAYLDGLHNQHSECV